MRHNNDHILDTAIERLPLELGSLSLPSVQIGLCEAIAMVPPM